MEKHVHNELLVIITNYACTLKCRDCANFIYKIPPEIKKQFIQPDQLKEDLDKLSTVLRTNRIQIQGGEATLHKELSSIIDIVNSSGISNNIQLVTNATHTLDEDVVDSLKRNKASVRISDYGSGKQDIEHWESVLKSNSIEYMLYKYAGSDGLWYDLGTYKMDRNNDDVDVQNIFSSCPFKVCWTLYDGQLTKCSRSSSSYLAGHHDFFYQDFIDVRHGQPETLAEHLNNMLQNKFMESCRYCHGITGKRITPGTQLDNNFSSSLTNKKLKAAFYYSLPFQLRVLEPVASEFEETLLSNNMNKIEEWKPDVIFTADSAQIPSLRKICDINGTILIGLRHGIANKYIPPENEYSLADYVCGSNWDKNEFDKSGIAPRKEFLITGNAWVDGIFGVPKREINKKTPTILFAPTYNPEVSAAVFFKDDLVPLIREVYPQSTIIIKPHPAIIDNDHPYVIMHQKLFQDLIAGWDYSAKKDNNVIFINNSKVAISDFFTETDILISDGSSLIFEFMVLNRPILLYTSDNKIEIWNDIYDSNALANGRRNVGSEFKNNAEFLKALKDAFRSHEEIHSQYQLQYTQEILGEFTDGLSYKRVAESVKNILNNRKSDLQDNFKLPAATTNINSLYGADKISNTPVLREKMADTPQCRAIAFYLPQYHPIPENDEWWGKGFTEWTNVAKARPLFAGHYQPHIPTDLGFYDLRLPEVRKAQADLAKEYGIQGFCYYHYWFNGKLLLQRPLQEVLQSKEPDFPFCVCWANENWTRAWDGGENQILIKQNYLEEDDRNHIRYLCNIFHDKRYIRIDGKPLFLVYRANQLPDPSKTALIWREEARMLGIGELYLCRVESFSDEHADPTAIGFDASVEFQPDWTNLGQRLEDPLYEGYTVYRYQDFVQNMMKKDIPPYRRFPCVTPSWDNSPRRKKDPVILIDSSPQLYEGWLKSTIKRLNEKAETEQIIFINAWNEWGEGNHLEPELKNGREYLEATRRALFNLEESDVVNDMIQAKYKASESLIKIGKEEQAITILEELLASDPNHDLAHNDLGVLYFQKGNAEQALIHLEKAAQLNPNDLDTLKNIADVYFQTSQSEKAISIYEKILTIDPEDVETLLVVGMLMYQINNVEKSSFYFKKVLYIDSNNIQAKQNLLLLERGENHVQDGDLKSSLTSTNGKERTIKIGFLLATKDDPEYNVFVATGMGFVAANLRKNLPQITVIFKESVEDMLREEPDLIGISSVTENYYIAIKMAETIKQHRNLPVVLGGIHISLIPESLKPCFDIGVIGEGEITFVDVVQTLLQENQLKPEALKAIPGIVFWEQGQLVKTTPRDVIKDLDSLPEPILEELPYYRPSKVACMVSARGCPFHCTFCASEKFARSYRSFSTKRILDIIENLIRNKNISHIVFYDDLLIANKKKISLLVEGLEQRRLLGKCSFSCQVRANVVTDDICSLLKKMNVVDTGIGIESFSDAMLRYYNKTGVTAEVNQRALDILHRHGIKVNPSIIFGAPRETREDMLMTFRKVYENIQEGKINQIAWGILRPYPGTQIWDYAEARGMVGSNMDWNRFSDWSNFKNYLCESVPVNEFFEMMEEWQVKNSLVRKTANGFSNFWINDPIELYGKIEDLKKRIQTRTKPELGDDMILSSTISTEKPLFADGWYQPEENNSRWMNQSAKLIFKNVQKEKFTFLFYIQPGVFNRIYQNSLELKVFNGEEQLMFQKQYTAANIGTGLNSIQFPIPRNQDVCLNIRFDKSMIPAEHGLSADTRRLSVLVKRVFII